jgi:hypothetical protein
MASLKHSASRSAAGIPKMVYRRALGGCGMPGGSMPPAVCGKGRFRHGE